MVLEGALHADETCHAFAVRVAVEHARFEAWSEKCGLNDAAVEYGEAPARHVANHRPKQRRFEDFIKHSGPTIKQVLSEIFLLMSQLSSAETKYASLINIEAEEADREGEADGFLGDVADITEPRPVDPSAVVPIGTMLQGGVHGKSAQMMGHTSSGRPGLKTRARQALEGNIIFNIATRVTRSTKTALKPKRLQWVIRDAEVCESKILKLSQLNNFLLESLDRAEKADMFQMVYLQMNSTKELVQHVRALLKAVALSDSATSTRGAEIDSSGTTLVETQSVATSALQGRDFIRSAGNFVIAAFEAAGDPPKSCVMPAMLLGQSVDMKTRSFTKMADGRNVWVEWRNYEDVNVAGHLKVDPKTVGRMDRLVTLLKIPTKPEEFCVPPCEGYFVDEEYTRIGMVFSAPAGATVESPRSLLDCLEGPPISLSSRVQIAQTLASWLLHLHSVCWFHKGIRSSSVLFFTAPQSAELGRPYVTGFDYARTAKDDSVTTQPPIGVDDNDLYVHPAYLDPYRTQGYRQVFDIYSLGVVLIELAYWQPIREILRDAQAVSAHDHQTSLTPVTVRDQILGNRINVLEGVKSRVGDKYASAVKACLNGIDALNDDETANAPEGALLYDFNRAVIEVLDGIAM